LSTFSRASQWFQEQGFSEFHAQLLVDLGVQQLSIVLIDSTAWCDNGRNHFIPCFNHGEPA